MGVINLYLISVTQLQVIMMNAGSIKKFRQLNGLKQETIAKKLCISQQAYAKLENRKDITSEKLEKVLLAMDRSLSEWKQFVDLYPPPR